MFKKEIKEENKSYFGGGVILYHNDKVLLQKVENKDFWEDFGGRTDNKDKTIIETSFREANEESNKILNSEFLEKRLHWQKEKSKKFYQDNLYFIYLIYVSKTCKEKLKPSLFGNKECHDKINRKVEWISIYDKNFKISPKNKKTRNHKIY